MSTQRGALSDRTVQQAAGGQIPNCPPPATHPSEAGPDHAAAASLAAPHGTAAVRQRSLRPGTQLSVVCERLDASGGGIARGMPDRPQGQRHGQAPEQPLVHVQNLLPGERAHVKVVHVSSHVGRAAAEPAAGKGAVFATLMHRYDASPERQIPACGAFGQCGGCTLQHLSYNAQVRFKHELVRELLADLLTPAVHPGLGSPPGAQVTVAPCVPSPQPLSYRSRVKLVAARAPAALAASDRDAGRIILGAYAPRSHRVIDMAGCKVNTPALRAVARTLSERWGDSGLSVYDEQTGRGALRYVLLREVRSGAVQLSLVVADPPPRAALLPVISALRAAHPQLASVVMHHNPHPGNSLLAAADRTTGAAADAELGEVDEPLLGPDFLYEDLGVGTELRLRVSARSFLQVNRDVSRRIYADVAAALAAAPGELILDLYCGVGGLGRTVQRPGTRLIGIETSASAVADATHSARAAGLGEQEARFLCGTVEEHLPALRDAGALSAAPLVLLNPPRRGCTKGVLSAVLACAPRAIAYVSCNPHSLARDLLAITASGYELTQVTPYDMHPGTPHIETVALLKRM